MSCWRIAAFWRTAYSLFDEILYDLDAQRITDFHLKPWADRFVILRHALYAEEYTGGREGDSFVSRQGKGVTPTDFHPINRLAWAA